MSIFAAFGCLLVYSTLKGANEIDLARSTDDDLSQRFRRSAESANQTEEEKNCSEPAYQEFPSDGFTNEQRSGGAIVIHVLIVSNNSIKS